LQELQVGCRLTAKQYETMIVVTKSELTMYHIAGTAHPPYCVSKMFRSISIIQVEALKVYIHDYRKVAYNMYDKELKHGV